MLMKIPLKSHLRNPWKVALLILAAMVILRETGIINIHAKSTTRSSCITKNTILRQDHKLSADSLDYTIWPSPLDYIPLYKTRTFEGVIQSRETIQENLPCIKINYKIEITSKGICSGYEFRQEVRKILDKEIADTFKPKPPKKSPAAAAPVA